MGLASLNGLRSTKRRRLTLNGKHPNQENISHGESSLSPPKSETSPDLFRLFHVSMSCAEDPPPAPPERRSPPIFLGSLFIICTRCPAVTRLQSSAWLGFGGFTGHHGVERRQFRGALTRLIMDVTGMTGVPLTTSSEFTAQLLRNSWHIDLASCWTSAAITWPEKDPLIYIVVSSFPLYFCCGKRLSCGVVSASHSNWTFCIGLSRASLRAEQERYERSSWHFYY